MAEICKVRTMRPDDLEPVLAWRNDPAVRSYMLTQHEIGLAEHAKWFDKVGNDPCRRLLIVEDEGQPIGFVQFSGVAEGGTADWGFHAVPGAAKGSGTKMGRAALDYAFTELKLHKVCGQALEFNGGSIALHQRLGFVQEGVLREQHRINGSYVALVCFGLLESEWRDAGTRL
jgi:UDP-4-amino-4,6-dideoxy-N-acetyl-beta-L-altrosamine N-acetyltransferase